MKKTFILLAGLIFVLYLNIPVFALAGSPGPEKSEAASGYGTAETEKAPEKTGKRIYVTNPGNNTISVIDPAKKEVVYTIRGGVWPAGLAVDKASGKLYVINSSEGDNSVSVIDMASNSIEKTVKVGGIGPMHITIDSAARTAYSTDCEHLEDGKNVSHTVSVIDLTTNTLKGTIEVGYGPFDLGIADNKIYTANSTDKTVSVIDIKSQKVTATIKIPDTPLGVGVDADKHRVYVASHGSKQVAVIDTKEDKVVELITLGAFPWYIAVDPSNDRMYVTQREGNAVSVINTKENKVIATLEVNQPVGIAVDPENNRVYVASHGDISAIAIDTKSNKIVDTIKMTLTPDSPYAGSPWGIAVN